MAEHNELGKFGEEQALAYLQQHGYDILETNWTFQKAEIDIIAQDQNELVVVEVKTRASSYLAGPEDTVSKGKQKSIVTAANQYIIENEIDLETRFDIVSIILNEKETNIDHLIDAFYPLR